MYRCLVLELSPMCVGPNPPEKVSRSNPRGSFFDLAQARRFLFPLAFLPSCLLARTPIHLEITTDDGPDRGSISCGSNAGDPKGKHDVRSGR